MFYTQSSTMRKIVELFLLIIVMAAIDPLFNIKLSEWDIRPFFFFILLFSLRYGLYIGVLSFLLVSLYRIGSLYIAGDDVLLLFYNTSEQAWFFIHLLTAIVCGLYSTSFRERYESLHYRFQETDDENQELTETITMLEHSHKRMQEKVLDSEHSLNRIFQIGLRLDQPSPELVRNEAINVLSELFRAETLGLYHVDSSKKSLRLRLRKGEAEHLPQTIFTEGDSHIYQRMLTQKTIILRTVEDEAEAPVLVGPIVSQDEVTEAIVIHQIDFAKLTSHELQIMSLILEWTATRINRANSQMQQQERNSMYPGTRIYKHEAFSSLVTQQEKRKEEFDIPYSILEIPFYTSVDVSLVETEIILRTRLRELDIIAYNHSTSTFYFLLPGTNQENAVIVRERIKALLQEKDGMYVS